MLTALRNKLRALLDERAEKTAEVDSILTAAEAEARSDLTEAEAETFSEIRARLGEIDSEAAAVEARIAELEELESGRTAAAAARSALGDPAPGAPEARETGRVSVGSEARTYRPDGRDERGRPLSFFADALAARQGSPSAQARLARHASEEVSSVEARDVGASAFGGLVVPLYLVDEFAPVLRDGRAFLNGVRQEPLPAEGMSLIIPRGQTGATVAAQASEGTAASETNVDYDDNVTVPVRTFAGQQDVSYQALERGTPGIDRLVYGDLVGAYAEAMDTSALNDDGTNGTYVGLLNMTGENVVTYTDASPTVVEGFPKFADAVQRIAANRKRASGVAWVMAPRRWGWFLASLDGSNRPLIVPDSGAAMNALGRMADEFSEGQVVGTLMGLPVIVDGNVALTSGGGTEDTVYAVRLSDVVLWEEPGGMPRELRFDDADSTGSLETKLVVYGYSAFTAERWPTGVSRISGTGLAAPSF